MNNNMAINTYLPTKESKKKKETKINKESGQKQTHGYREYFDNCQMGRRLGGQAK